MCVAGDPSAKDLEQLFSLGSFSSQGSQSRSSWSHSGLKTKRGSLKQEKRKISDRKDLSDSPHIHKKDNLSKLLETKDGKSSRIKESEATSDTKVPTCDISQEIQFPKLQKPEVVQETVRLHKPESRKAPRRQAPGPEHETLTGQNRDDEHEQEERRRKRRSDVSESFPSQVKNRFGSKHLEKTVSIRLVDIRNSDTDEYLMDEGMTRRSPVSLDVTNTKLNRAAVLSDAAAATKTNGWLRKTPANGSHTPNRPAAGHLKGWGKFRIPKRSEKHLTTTEEEEEEHRKPLLRPLTNTPEPSYPRTRLRTGTENDGYASDSDSKPDDGEMEPCLKRCHSHQLRGDSSLGRRYGSDIIRRGVLAS